MASQWAVCCVGQRPAIPVLRDLVKRWLDSMAEIPRWIPQPAVRWRRVTAAKEFVERMLLAMAQELLGGRSLAFWPEI
jgi:hypothetical protein